jgi:hypothetical protein
MAVGTRSARRRIWPRLIAAACLLACACLTVAEDSPAKTDGDRKAELLRVRELQPEKIRQALFQNGPTNNDQQLEYDVSNDADDEPINRRFVERMPNLRLTITSQFQNLAFGTRTGVSSDNLSMRLGQILDARVLAVHLVCRLTEAQRQKLILAGRGDIARLVSLIERQLEACRLLDERSAAAVPREIAESAAVVRTAIESGPFHERSIYLKTLTNSLSEKQRADYDVYRRIERLGGKVHLRSRENREIQTIRMTDAAFRDSGLIDICRLTNLQGLILDYTQVTDAGLAHLENLTELEILDLGGTGVTGSGLPHLRHLQKLQWLDLRRTPLTDLGLAELGPLTGLRALHAEHTPITGAGFENLARLTNLETLKLTQTRVGDAGLAHLRQFKQLKELSLEGTTVTDEGLRHLSGLTCLESLDLRRTAVTDAGLVHLAGLSRLQNLYLFGTDVTDAGIASLSRSLPDTQIVR